MRTFLCLLAATTALLMGCRDKSSKSRVAPLTIYIVSTNKIEKGQFIPDVGYISSEPDLIITRLDMVSIDPSPAEQASPSNRPSISIAMNSEDAPRFMALTEKAIGQKILLAVGDQPLSAPRVNAVVTNGRPVLTLAPGKDPRIIEATLKKLQNGPN